MNFLSAILLLLASVLMAQAQCPGRPANPLCTEPRNAGRRGTGCVVRQMWWYDAGSRSCKRFRYLGCGGNNNRWCSKAECDRSCPRR